MNYKNYDSYFEIDLNIPSAKRKYLVVVIYDIMDNKRRNKLVKYLKGFGFRVQRSAFECIIDKNKYQKLVDGIPKYLAKEDLLRIYRLAGYADVKMWGQVGETEIEEVVIV
ncbi:MAG: CRISPR-associated endonuclease Cas2 [Desulfitobacteriia bacterium]|jgi:CRISPR-associated protein Cas2